MTSKTCVGSPLGVLAMNVRTDLTVPSNDIGSDLVGGLTRHDIQSTVLPGIAGEFAGIGCPVHHQWQPFMVT